jgi:DNA-binding transcriptional LysR family regulator
MKRRQLEYLVAAVEEGTFTAAAARCFVSQPSLSAAIAQLEAESGTLLFHRVGRSIRPTAECEALVPLAREALRGFDAVQEAMSAPGRLVGRVDLAVQPTLAVRPTVEIVARVRAEHPEVVVRLVSPAEDESVADLVASGRCELGLAERSSDRTLRWQRIGAEEYVILHPRWRGEDDGRIESLVDRPVVTGPAGSPTRLVLDEACARAGFTPRVVVEADHRDAILPLVLAGVGSTVLPASALPLDPDPDLRWATLPGLRRSIGIVWRDAPLTPAARALRRCARG